jgi:hypothetical protein
MKFSALLILTVVIAVSSSFVVARAQSEPEDQLISKRLTSLSASNGGQPTDCGSTTINRPGGALCARAAFEERKPFYILYSSRTFGLFKSIYGLAGDTAGNIYEVEYDSRGLLNLGLGKKSQVFDGNRIRVTTCLKPIRLGSTQEGLLACITPVNEQESQLVAHQQKPLETTVCAILEHPSAFNNKMVRIHGYASGNFEYSELGADGCSRALWFIYGNGEGPPDLAVTVSGGARPGSEDAEGRLILPVPVKLVQDSNFQRFQKLMRARAEADERSLKEDANSFTFHRVAATFIGRIDGVPDDVHAFHLKRKDMDRADFLGFGQMGLFDAQFVLQSVEHGAVLEKFPPIPKPEPSKPPKSDKNAVIGQVDFACLVAHKCRGTSLIRSL